MENQRFKTLLFLKENRPNCSSLLIPLVDLELARSLSLELGGHEYAGRLTCPVVFVVAWNVECLEKDTTQRRSGKIVPTYYQKK
jgi:hypothetical protein